MGRGLVVAMAALAACGGGDHQIGELFADLAPQEPDSPTRFVSDQAEVVVVGSGRAFRVRQDGVQPLPDELDRVLGVTARGVFHASDRGVRFCVFGGGCTAAGLGSYSGLSTVVGDAIYMTELVDGSVRLIRSEGTADGARELGFRVSLNRDPLPLANGVVLVDDLGGAGIVSYADGAGPIEKLATLATTLPPADSAAGLAWLLDDNNRLYRTDGTTAETVALDLPLGGERKTLIAVPGGAFIVVPSFTVHIYFTDGTASGTRMVDTGLRPTEFGDLPPTSTLGTTLFVRVAAGGVLRVDGLTGQKERVTDSTTCCPGLPRSDTTGRAYYVYDGQLWSTNGTDGGNPVAGPFDRIDLPITVSGDRAFLSAQRTGTPGRQPYAVSRGEPLHQLAEIVQARSSSPTQFVRTGDWVYFVTTGEKRSLRRTDGVVVEDLFDTGGAGFPPVLLPTRDGGAWLLAGVESQPVLHRISAVGEVTQVLDHPGQRPVLWVWDDTAVIPHPAGTLLIDDAEMTFVPFPSFGSIGSFAADGVDAYACFNGRVLYYRQGSTAWQELPATPGPAGDPERPACSTVAVGGLGAFARIAPPSEDAGLWALSGGRREQIAEGTVQIVGVTPERLFYSGPTGLFASDGTPGGATRVAGGTVTVLGRVGDRFVVAVNGQSVGTRLLFLGADIEELIDTGSARFVCAARVGERAWFMTEDGRRFDSNGTVAGTVELRLLRGFEVGIGRAACDLAVLPGGAVVYRGFDPATGSELWRADPEPAR